MFYKDGFGRDRGQGGCREGVSVGVDVAVASSRGMLVGKIVWTPGSFTASRQRLRANAPPENQDCQDCNDQKRVNPRNPPPILRLIPQVVPTHEATFGVAGDVCTTIGAAALSHAWCDAILCHHRKL